LATWLDRQLGQSVTALDLQTPFPGFDGGALGDTALCAPLLGVLLRAETRKL
jgi:MSHA biogenesis protein MshI